MKSSILILTLVVLVFTNTYSENYFIATIAGRTSGTITKLEFIQADELKPLNNDSSFQIIEFRMTLICKDPQRFRSTKKYKTDIYGNPELTSSSAALTIEMKQAINYLEAGCKVYIEYIKVKSKDKEFKAQPIALTITD